MTDEIAQQKNNSKPEIGDDRSAQLTRLVSRDVIFYLWLPLGIGLFMGATQAGRTTNWPLALGLSYFVVICCVDWWLVDLGCRACKAALRPWRPSLWVILICGSTVAAVVAVKPANWAIIQTWHALLPANIPKLELPAFTFWGPIEELVAGLTPWLLANYLFYRFGNMPRFGFEPPAPGRSPAEANGSKVADHYATTVLKKVRSDRRGELLALNAQGHYLRVITKSGEDLILYRFGDAVAEMPREVGVQVHRSWWISQAAIDDCESVSAKKLCLGNGLTIPVSRTYRQELERRISD